MGLTVAIASLPGQARGDTPTFGPWTGTVTVFQNVDETFAGGSRLQTAATYAYTITGPSASAEGFSYPADADGRFFQRSTFAPSPPCPPATETYDLAGAASVADPPGGVVVTPQGDGTWVLSAAGSWRVQGTLTAAGFTIDPSNGTCLAYSNSGPASVFVPGWEVATQAQPVQTGPAEQSFCSSATGSCALPNVGVAAGADTVLVWTLKRPISGVVDTVPPVISNVPKDIVAEATGPGGAVVTFASPTASDLVDGVVPVTCLPASGSTFALGATTVTCKATDASGNSASASFLVTVVDTTPPAISGVPADITVEATDPAGAAVTFSTPTALDLVDGAVAVSCLPASGTVFSVGDTTVSCLAGDTRGNKSAPQTFTVHVTAAQVGLSIDDVSRAEGDLGTTAAFVFSVRLSRPSAKIVTAGFTTVAGTATSPSDYAARTNTVSFAAGQTLKTIVVNVKGDNTFEPDETFAVHLTTATNATLADADGLGTVENDDPVPSLSVTDVGSLERNTGSAAFGFEVTLSNPSLQAITVAVQTVDGSATAPSDYNAKAVTLTFAPGQTTKTVNVTVKGDTMFEPDETFGVHLSAPTNATTTDADGSGSIGNDDQIPSLSVSDFTSQEGDSGSSPFGFQVTLSNPSSQTITVTVQTANGSATAPTDYVAKTTSVTFAPGQTQKTVNVSVKGDTTLEQSETFTLRLLSPTNATIVGGVGIGTIVNDD